MLLIPLLGAAPIATAPPINASIKEFFALRKAHRLATQSAAEVPEPLVARLRQCIYAISDHGAVGENFLFSHLRSNSGVMQAITVEGLLRRERAAVSVRLFRAAEHLNEQAFLTLCKQIPLGHLTLKPSDLGRFVSNNPLWRRSGVMTLLARAETPSSMHYLVECPLVDRKDPNYSPAAMRISLGQFHSSLQNLVKPEAIAAVATALQRKPRNFAKGPQRFAVETRAVITIALAELGDVSAVPIMLRNLRGRSRELAIASARALGILGDKESLFDSNATQPQTAQLDRKSAFVALERALRRRSGVEFALVTIEALAKVDAQLARPSLLKAARSKDWRVRSVAAHSLSRLPVTSDVKAQACLCTLLSDSMWQVRKAALDTIHEHPTSQVVGALIESLHLQRGGLRARIYQALTAWTGQDFGPHPKLWREYWQLAAPTFTAKKRAPRRGSTRVAYGDPTTPQYFGNEILSQDVAFLIDISGSMNQRYTARLGTGEELTAAGIHLVQQELWQTLEKLKDTQRFNIVSFSTQSQRLFPHLLPANDSTRHAATRFFESMQATGGTNLYDPLEELLKANHLETIYILSDGEPTRGSITSPELILRQVQRLNRYRQITIHCFALGRSSKLLEQLAEQNGGVYRRVDEEMLAPR